jgi:hypothetical protein
MSRAIETILGSPIWRHAITLVIGGIAFGTLQTQVAYTQIKQDEISGQQGEFIRAMESLKDVFNDLRVGSAVTQQQVTGLKEQLDGMNRKLDTLIWRSGQQAPQDDPGDPAPRRYP